MWRLLLEMNIPIKGQPCRTPPSIPQLYQDLRFNKISTVIAKHVLLPNSRRDAGLDLSRGLLDREYLSFGE